MVKTTSTKIGDWIVASICFLLILICLLPVINILSRSLSDPLALVRNEVLLLPMAYDRESGYEYILDSSGNNVTETAILRFTKSGETLSVENRIVRDINVIDEATGLETGETAVSVVPLSQIYERNLHGNVEVKLESGERIDSITVGGITYTDDFDDETGVGTIIIQNAEIRKTRSTYTSKLGIDTTNYSKIFVDSRYIWSLAWTAMLTVACALWSVFMTAICAYPLTYDHLKGRKFFNTVIILTMYFGAGTIPTYLLLKSLGLIDHPLVLALPFCLSVFNMIIMRSYFYGIPISLRESAELDGAGPVRTMLSIYIPLSMPVIATLLLFYAVGRWNGYSDAMMFMNGNRTFYPIQYLLYNMLQGIQSPEVGLTDPDRALGTAEGMRMAMVMFAMVPILVVYPFLQRYFIAGVTLGAVKE